MMRSFDACLRPGCFWCAALVPPMAFFALVQIWDAIVGSTAPVAQVVAIVALAQAMPVAALAWMLCSVAGYSVGAGRLVVHRVVHDREYPLAQLEGGPELRDGVIRVVINGRRLRLRVADPAGCLVALRLAAQR